MSNLKITLLQNHILWADIPGNLQHWESQIQNIQNETDLILLPEMFATGFMMHPREEVQEMSGSIVNWMSKMAAQKNVALAGSIIIKENNKTYNRLVFVFPDGKITYYDKRHLFGMAGEDEVYTAGKEKVIIEYKDWKICPMICYDLRFPVWSRNKNEYDLLIYLANWPTKRIAHWRALLQARAIENQCYVAAVNRIGQDGNNLDYCGGSTLIDPAGEIIWQQEDEATNLTFNINKENIIKIREQLPFLKDQDEFEIKI